MRPPSVRHPPLAAAAWCRAAHEARQREAATPVAPALELRRRGDTHLLELCVGGMRHRLTLRTPDRAVAERMAREAARDLEAVRARTAAGLPTAIACGALFDVSERQELPTLARGTPDAYRDSLKPLRAYFVEQLGAPTIDRVRAKDVTGYLAWRRVARIRARVEGAGEAPPAAPLANRTLQKDRAVLHRVFALAERLEYRDGNPVARVAAPKADSRDPVILSADEYERLLAACGGADRPMLALYVLTLGEAGLRCESEALRLRWEDVDLEQGFLWIASGRDGHGTKGGKGRWVPMTGRLAATMRAHFAAFRLAGRSPWVFHHVVTRAAARRRPQRLTAPGVRRGGRAGRAPRGSAPARPAAPARDDVARRGAEPGARQRGDGARGPAHDDGRHAPGAGAPAEPHRARRRGACRQICRHRGGAAPGGDELSPTEGQGFEP